MHVVQQYFTDFLEQHPELRIQPVLLACSGGVDSMSLCFLAKHVKLNFAVAHCNFQLRNEASEADEKMVKNWCTENNIPFHYTRFDTKAYSREKGISVEMAARELRYAFFDQLKAEYDYEYLLTAHHADDSLETILLNLGRGTGLKGMSGILPDQNKIGRPLWLCSKGEIIDFAKSKKIKWRDDETNFSDDYQRNKLRHEVLPPLKEAFPAFDQSVKRSLQQLKSDQQLFRFLLAKELQQLLSHESGIDLIVIEDLLPVEGFESILRHWLAPLGFSDFKALLNAVAHPQGQLFFTGEHEILVDRNHIILRPKAAEIENQYTIEKDDKEISQPLSMRFSRHEARTFDIPKNSRQAALDLQKLQFPLTLRKWREGDRFNPLGMKGSKKLSDFLVDEKLSRFQKGGIWLLCSGSEIAWVVGLRVDDRFKITDTTKTIYFVQLF